MSTGTADSVALRGCVREPTTTVSSANPASRPRIERAAQVFNERVRLAI